MILINNRDNDINNRDDNSGYNNHNDSRDNPQKNLSLTTHNHQAEHQLISAQRGAQVVSSAHGAVPGL